MFVSHRINTVAELIATPHELGIEVDLRDFGDQIVLAHDPFVGGELFADFLRAYRHAFIILNVKSERVEFRVLELLRQHGVEDYFFLDCSFPMVITLARQGETRIALRYSEYESLESIRLMQDRISWVWVDCFSRMPLSRADFDEIKRMGLKVCLVSPELQGQADKIDEHISDLRSRNIQPDMVCSKIYNLQKWQEIFN